MEVSIDLDKLTLLTERRSNLCKIQQDLYKPNRNIALAWFTTCGVIADRLDAELERSLKLQAHEFCQKKIEQINEEIEELYKCQEQ